MFADCVGLAAAPSTEAVRASGGAAAQCCTHGRASALSRADSAKPSNAERKGETEGRLNLPRSPKKLANVAANQLLLVPPPKVALRHDAVAYLRLVA